MCVRCVVLPIRRPHIRVDIVTQRYLMLSTSHFCFEKMIILTTKRFPLLLYRLSLGGGASNQLDPEEACSLYNLFPTFDRFPANVSIKSKCLSRQKNYVNVRYRLTIIKIITNFKFYDAHAEYTATITFSNFSFYIVFARLSHRYLSHDRRKKFQSMGPVFD